MDSRMTIVYPGGLNKGFGSKLGEHNQLWYKIPEGQLQYEYKQPR